MRKFGFKEITPQNWLEPDDALDVFVRMDSIGKTRTITSDEYLHSVLEPKLLESVPLDIQALFDVARGAMIYGYFFYPLYTLAMEQLFRVAESAVTYKCKVLRVPGSIKTFEKKIEWLAKEGIISKIELVKWQAVRYLRNKSSHPERQAIRMPGQTIRMLKNIAELTNTLFNGS